MAGGPGGDLSGDLRRGDSPSRGAAPARHEEAHLDRQMNRDRARSYTISVQAARRLGDQMGACRRYGLISGSRSGRAR